MKIDIKISGHYGCGKTTMLNFLYSILSKYEFDIKLFDNGLPVSPLKINLEEFSNFKPLKTKINIETEESNFKIENKHLKLGEITTTKSFKQIQDKLFKKEKYE